MPGYGYTQRAPAPQKSADNVATGHRPGGQVAVPDAAMTSHGVLADVLNEGPRTQSLLQMRRAFDEGPGVRSQLALQRALNCRGAGPAQDGPMEASPPQPASAPIQREPNDTGLPDQLKAGVEQLSGIAMDDVRVHFNSPKPATVQAHAYAQGTDIHLGPRQEKHLPHEAWHVVQQKQGRVKPTLQLKGIVINDNSALEREADRKADDSYPARPQILPEAVGLSNESRILHASIQRKITEDEEKQKPYPAEARAKRMPALVGYRLSDEQLAEADALHAAETLYSPSEVAESVGAQRESKLEPVPSHPKSPRPQGLGGRTERFRAQMNDAQMNLNAYLLKIGGDLAAAEHQIIAPVPVSNKNNCHGFTVTGQRDKSFPDHEFLDKIGEDPAVVFVKRGRIAHSGKLLPGNKLHHLLMDVGELISEIRGNMGYDGRYDLPRQRAELDKYLQRQVSSDKVMEMLNTISIFELKGELKGEDLKNVQDLRQRLYELQDKGDTGQIPEELISQYLQLTQGPDLKAEAAEDTSDSDSDLPDLEPA